MGEVLGDPSDDCKAQCKVIDVAVKMRESLVRLANDPLVLVLCEVRFAPVLAMDSHVPAIQDRLRRVGYPGFDQISQQQIEFVPQGPPKISAQTRWVFRNAERTAVAILGTSNVVVQTSRYERFEEFLGQLRPVLEAVAEIVAPAFRERIGLRYVNAVEAIGDEMASYFSERVLSFTPADLEVESLLIAHHVVGKTPRGQIMIRLNQVSNGPLVPLDVVGPEFPELAKPREGIHAILDIDGVDELSGDFDAESIEGSLWEIHNYTERAFWSAITPKAREEWGETTVTVSDGS